MPDTVRRCRPLLGTFVEIEAEAHAETVEEAFAAVAHVHRHMSFHEAGSDLRRLAAATPGEAVEVDPQTVTVLRFAVALHRATGGLFDVAIGARLVGLGYLPRPPGIDLRRMTGTAADIEIDSDDKVRCHRPTLIDLGGIAKGFAVDKATTILADRGCAGGSVDAGGDLRVFGTPRKIGLRDADGLVRRCFVASDIAVATSSNRHLRRRRYGATVTPHLGSARRAISCDIAVTVAAAECMVADAFTKVAMADRMLARSLLPGYGGRIIDDLVTARAA